jgi:hypothetical protein
MSPLSSPDPCFYIIHHEDFIFCENHEGRPQDCVNHRHPFRFCPVGLEKLNLVNIEDIRQRIDKGWQIIKEKLT